VRRHGAGFTLLEVLVATSLFAILSTLAYGGLQRVRADSHDLTLREQRITQLQLAHTRLQADLSQARPRPVRDRLGSPLAAFSGRRDGARRLSLTTPGRHKLLLGPGASRLTRVDYLYQGGRLYRVQWPVLDRAHATTARRTLLLDGIHHLDLRFRGRVWHDLWPLAANDSDAAVLPQAVELVLEMDDGLRYRWLLLVNAA